MDVSIRRMAHGVLRSVVETIYPKICSGCGLRGDWLCEFCEGTVPSANLTISCRRCGVPQLDHRCGCAQLDPVIDIARSAFVYDGWASEAVKRLKYHGELARAEHLGPLMMPLLSAFGKIDGLIPVPLHSGKERTRGYNQATVLALHLSRETGIPILPVIWRTINTPSQTTLSGRERFENVEGAFVLDPTWIPPTGRRFVLVDDVRTTGATLGACARELAPFRTDMIGAVTFALDMHQDRIATLRRMGI